jgi:type IV pilus assembly protein PilP
MRYFLVLAAVVLITACSPKLDDLQAYTQSVSENAVHNIEPYPEFATPKTFEYSASELPSPFDSPK